MDMPIIAQNIALVNRCSEIPEDYFALWWKWRTKKGVRPPASSSEAQLSGGRIRGGGFGFAISECPTCTRGCFPLLGARLVFGPADEMQSVLLSRRSRISSRSDFIPRSRDWSQSEQLAMPPADGFSWKKRASQRLALFFLRCVDRKDAELFFYIFLNKFCPRSFSAVIGMVIFVTSLPITANGIRI